MDGNKRAGYFLMETILMKHGLTVGATDEEVYNFVNAIATGELTFDDIVIWLEKNAVRW